jgi:Fur family peroxide stress response transcriptional regulator
MERLSSIFKENNLKLTPQRYAIYKYLMQTKSHPSAEMIYQDLKEEYPMMSLATVYKTVKTLIDLELIQEFNVGEDNFRFDSNTSMHPHIVCLSCGRVDDMVNADFTHLNKDAEDYTDYQIEAHQIFFYGLCPKCKGSK